MRFFQYLNQWKNTLSQGLIFAINANHKEKIIDIPLPKSIHLRLHKNASSIFKADENQTVHTGQVLQFDPLEKQAPVVAPFSGTLGKQFKIDKASFIELHVAEKKYKTHNDEKHLNINDIGKSEIKKRIYEAGLTGMGGAGYPSHLKLNEKKESIIMNAIECEPLVDCDNTVLRLYPFECLMGLVILAKAVDANQFFVALKNDAFEAKEALEKVINESEYPLLKKITFSLFNNIYPLGSEKSINKIIFKDEVPKGKHISDLNRIIFNVSTCFTTYLLFANNTPVQWRMLSFVDMREQSAINCRVPMGTPLKQFLASIQQPSDSNNILFGGLMMGRKVSNLSMPIEHTTHAIFKLSGESSNNVRPCIRCGACDEVCPIQLLPQQLFYFHDLENEEKLTQHGLFDCIECGCCQYVCPSHIPLVEIYQIAKEKLRKNHLIKERADLAKVRFDSRENRLVKLETERLKKIEEKKKAARLLLKSKGISKETVNTKQSAIEKAKEAARKQREKVQNAK